MKLETEGLKDMQDALRKYDLASSKTREEVLMHRGNRFAWSLFGVFNAQGRRTKRKIMATRAGKMVVRNGGKRTRGQEKARRIFAAGYTATGWLPAMRRLTKRGTARPLADVKNPKGSVKINMKKLVIELINSTPGAWEADKKHRLSDKAARKQAADMQKYLQRKADQDLKRSWK